MNCGFLMFQLLLMVGPNLLQFFPVLLRIIALSQMMRFYQAEGPAYLFFKVVKTARLVLLSQHLA